MRKRSTYTLLLFLVAVVFFGSYLLPFIDFQVKTSGVQAMRAQDSQEEQDILGTPSSTVTFRGIALLSTSFTGQKDIVSRAIEGLLRLMKGLAAGSWLLLVASLFLGLMEGTGKSILGIVLCLVGCAANLLSILKLIPEGILRYFHSLEPAAGDSFVEFLSLLGLPAPAAGMDPLAAYHLSDLTAHGLRVVGIGWWLAVFCLLLMAVVLLLQLVLCEK